MNAKFLLDQLLNAGGDLTGQRPSAGGASTDPTAMLSSLISGKGGAAMAGGALGLLLGSKKGRKMGGKVLTYGGLAVLGAMAFKAYQNHQKGTVPASGEAPQPLHQLSGASAESHGRVVLVALIAASKADGHIDDRERQLIDSEIRKMTSDPELQQWFDKELKKPLDPAEVASHAKDQIMASEMYLASLLAVDEQNFMEKSYVEELARQLKLPPSLQVQLAGQVKEAMASVDV
jgi:uncharacterized membrane protein YebE (DUF533 family)